MAEVVADFVGGFVECLAERLDGVGEDGDFFGGVAALKS